MTLLRYSIVSFFLLLGILSCSDKVVTETTYQDSFSVPIHNSGIPDSLAYDKVYFTLKNASTGEILFQDSAGSGFVNGSDPLFVFTSSERYNLIVEYQVIANGTVILSLKDYNVYSSDNSKVLPQPTIADEATIAAICEEQAKVESHLKLRADSKHAACVLSFEPSVIDTVGTKEIPINFNSNEEELCAFQGWEVEISSGTGSATLLDTSISKSNTVRVNGVSGFITAHFLFQNELPKTNSSSVIPQVSSEIQASSMPLVSSTPFSSSSLGPLSSSDTLSSSSSSSLLPLKTLYIYNASGNIPYQFNTNTSFDLDYKVPPNNAVTSWDTVKGVSVSWKNGSDSTWVVTLTYEDYTFDSEYALAPKLQAISNSLIESSMYTNLPARLYYNPNSESYFTFSMLDNQTIGIDRLSFQTDHLELEFQTGSTILGLPLDYTNPYFHSRIAFGKNSFGAQQSIPVIMESNSGLEELSIGTNQTGSTFKLDTIPTEKQLAVVGSAVDVDPSTKGSIVHATVNGRYPDSVSIISMNKISTTTNDKIRLLHGLSGTLSYVQINDICTINNIAVGALTLRLSSFTSTPQQHFMKVNFTDSSQILTSTSEAGAFLGIIPKTNSTIGTFVAFGNRDMQSPEIVILNSNATVIYSHQNTTVTNMEYTGGIELPGGKILAWGGPIDAWSKGSSTASGVLALYTEDLELVWSRSLNYQPFGAAQLPNGTFLVGGFANTSVKSKAVYQQIGYHGE